MSNEERNEYMRNVRWTTAIYTVGAAGSLLLGMVGLYYGLKGDMKDIRTEAREEIQNVSNRLNAKMDSVQNNNILQFQEIKEQLDNRVDVVKNVIINPKRQSALYIEKKDKNGRVHFEQYVK